MRVLSRSQLDAMGVTRPRGEKASWAEILYSAAFVFVFNMAIFLTDAPTWQWLVPVAGALVSCAVLYVVVIRPDKKECRAIVPRARPRSRRRMVIFSAAAGIVVLGISVGTPLWGYSSWWGVGAAGLYMPSVVAFVLISLWREKRHTEGPPAVPR